jgi:S-adenosylmethionine:tRNA ribosyltransferase-isomerase
MKSASDREFTLSDFDFALPPDLIAQQPATERSASRLLDGRQAQPIDRIFNELPGLLQPGDLLVFNDTQVIKARLHGHKPTGGAVELLVERVLPDLPGAAPHQVVAHMKVSKKPLPGTRLQMHGGFTAELLGRWPNEQGMLFRFAFSASPHELMAAHGHVPLPPYIEHEDDAEDERRYQTIFAREPGAVAAPTAALHFDESVLDDLAQRGVKHANVTLHVGAGTFQPVKTERIDQHVMHHEWYRISEQTIQAIQNCRQQGGRVLAVGTTTVRTLESWAQTGQAQGDTNIFITPGHRFQMVDLLLTNFHLPKSTLMMLVSAFAGHSHIMALYQHAIEHRYRFFSYGDAMLLQRTHQP